MTPAPSNTDPAYALDPREPVPYWLTEHAGIPEKTRPAFLFRPLTCGAFRRLVNAREQLEELLETKDPARRITAMEWDLRAANLIMPHLAGVRNRPPATNADELLDQLFPEQLSELLFGFPEAVATLGANQKKASTSPSADGGVSSAGDAPTDAAKPPTPQSPSS